MSHQCISIRSKDKPGEQCPYRAHAGSSWCGHHAKQKSPQAFAPASSIEHSRMEDTAEHMSRMTAATHTIQKACRRWIARRGGPLVWFREESNNPYDFFSSDPVADIPLRDFVSFVDAGKGYCMDSKSAMSLVTHANNNREPALNPFTRAQLPPTFLRRLRLHGAIGEWEPLQAQTPEQTLALAVTDLFRAMEDLGYYTDPAWFTSLGRTSLQRFYIELADI